VKKAVIIFAWIFSCIFCFVAGNIFDAVVKRLHDPFIVTLNVERKPTFEITLFVVDSQGVPVPNARIGLLSNSGWTYSETNEFGYSAHLSGEDDILSISVNKRVILKERDLFFPWYEGIGRKVFLIRTDN
jgi:hypothetical protein